MRRFFTKSGKGEGEPEASESKEDPAEKDEPSTSAEAKRKSQRNYSDSENEEIPKRKGEREGGHAEKRRPRRRRSGGGDYDTSVDEPPSKPSKRHERRQKSEDEEEESESNLKRSKVKRKPLKAAEEDDEDGKLLRPKPKPRPKLGESSRTYSDLASETDDDDDVVEKLQTVKSKPEEPKSKGKKRTERALVEKGQSSSSLINDSSREEYSQFLNKEDVGHLTKIEPGKGNHYLSSTCNYKRPISTFKVRTRLLKYPTFADQGQWSGDFAVVDERVFGWQEKVFSSSEAKKYQKLDNCVTEKEKEYHEKIKEHPDSIGKHLYSYVSDDTFVTKKKERLLVRRCPVPHIRKSKNGSRYSIIDAKSGASDDDSLDTVLDGNDSGNESIDFDEPVSSSTPKTKRKEENDKANMDRKENQRKEKESKDLEKKNRKLQEAKEKREKLEEKKKQQREAKKAEELKKLKEAEDNEKEIRKEYMKKYKYSKRPSLPLGARLRSVQLTPSPRKLSKRRKSRGISRSSEFSTDYQEEEERGSEDDSSKSKSKKGLKGSESESLKTATDDRSRALRRVGYERGDGTHISSRYRSQDAFARKSRRKFQDRFSYRNSQTMFIMASIPHLPGRYREVVVCMIRHVPNQGILVFKPGLGYRNIEAKRNHLYRVSCEQFIPHSHERSFKQGLERSAAQKTQALDDFVGLFELVPRNELRVTVMGEITTLEGFDTSPLCVYYVVDIPKGWRNDSVLSNTEGITHTCYTDNNSVGHLSHEFSFHLSFSMDSVENGNSYPTPVIAFMVVSMKHMSPRIIYDGYGYLSIPMTPGSHYVNVKTWKPRPRTIVEKMRATFLNITPSLQDMKFAHIPHSEYDDFSKANLIGLQTEPSGSVKFRLHVIHQTPSILKGSEKKLDLLEKMSSATILKSVQAVIEAFQRAREKAATLKNQYQTIN